MRLANQQHTRQNPGAASAITLWVVHILEPSAPEGTKPLEWFLLITCAIDSIDDAQACLRWYCLRWRIEDWYRVLKTGCRIEDLAHYSAERLERAIAIKLASCS